MDPEKVKERIADSVWAAIAEAVTEGDAVFTEDFEDQTHPHLKTIVLLVMGEPVIAVVLGQEELQMGKIAEFFGSSKRKYELMRYVYKVNLYISLAVYFHIHASVIQHVVSPCSLLWSVVYIFIVSVVRIYVLVQLFDAYYYVLFEG